MSHLRDVAELRSQPKEFKSHVEADIYCKLAKQDVTLVCNANGVVVCRSWKKCRQHSLDTCPEKIAYQAMLAEMKKKGEERQAAHVSLLGILRR